MRVAVVFHRLGPYHNVRLQATANHFELTAIELSAQTREYAWSKVPAVDYRRITLFEEIDSRSASIFEIERRMKTVLMQCAPEVVALPGWSDKGALSALQWCNDNSVPAILMSESTVQDEPRTWWKEFVKRQIVKCYCAALVGGQRHIDYLVALGVPRDSVFTGYDVVDNEYFARTTSEVRSREPGIRDQHGLPENYFLASARFLEKKNLPRLLRAFANYCISTADKAWKLVLLGDGPLKSDLCRLISELGLKDHVLLPGFKQYDELPLYYGLASAFVHASKSEPWGLVVNEAVASGLPVIVSERCGCAPELVKGNGFTFDPVDEQALRDRLIEMSQLSKTELKHLSSVSVQIASDFGAERFGEGLKRAAEVARSIRPRKPGLTSKLVLGALMHR